MKSLITRFLTLFFVLGLFFLNAPGVRADDPLCELSLATITSRDGLRYFEFFIDNSYSSDKNFTIKAKHVVTDGAGNESFDYTIANEVKIAANKSRVDYLMLIKPAAPNGKYRFVLTVNVDGNNVCPSRFAPDATLVGQSESDPIDSTLTKIENPTSSKFSSVADIITALVPNIFAIAGLLAFVFLSWGGVRYALARGDAKAADSARQTITNSIIGLVIVLVVFAIFEIITAVFKISIFGLAPTALAQVPPPPAPQAVDIGCAVKLGTTCIKDAFPSFGSLVTVVLAAIGSLMGLIFFALLIWGGIRYMLSRGDEKATQEARTVLTNAAIGLLIVLGAFAIITLIGLLTGQSSLLP